MTFWNERIQLENIQYFARLRGRREPNYVLCAACDGECVVEVDCERCAGTGEHECCCPDCSDYHTAACGDCDGEGKLDAACPSCGGSGRCDAALVRPPPDDRTLPLFPDDELREAS